MNPPQYRSSRSVAKDGTIYIDSQDPRAKPDKLGITQARSGAEIQVVDINPGNSISAITSNILVQQQATASAQTDPNIVIPPMANQPPKYYPGGSGAYVNVLTTPTSVTATFQTANPNNLEVDFTWDPSDPANLTATGFTVYLTDSTGNTATYANLPITAGTTSQSVVITPLMSTSMFNVFTTTFTSIGIQATDPLNNTSSIAYAATMPVYVLHMNSPKIIPAGVSLGYTVNFWEDTGAYGNGTYVSPATVGVPPLNPAYSGIEIWEVESPQNSTPAVILNSANNPIGWTKVYAGQLDPINISTTDTLYRYVIARFSSIGGTYTSFCLPVGVQPVSPVSVNVKVPTEASATAAWGGPNNTSLIINYSLPGSTATITNAVGDGTNITYTASNTFNAGDPVQITGVSPSGYNVSGVVGANPTSTSFQVLGTTTATYVSGGTATSTNNAGASFIVTLTANNQTGFFYYTPTSISLSGTITLPASNLLNYFSQPLPNSFNITLQSVSSVGVKSNGISVSIIGGPRTDTLSSVTPDGSTVSVASVVDGYTVNANYSSTDASTMQVYQFFTNPTWVGSDDVPDYLDAQVSTAWSSSSPNHLVVNNLTAENGGYTIPSGVLPYTGYQITSSTSGATYIAGSDYNYITGITGSGPYTLTLANPLTSLTAPPVGTNVHLQSKSYDGTGPANIFLNYTNQVWLIVAFYNIYGARSKSSAPFTVTPTSATTTLINQAIALAKGSGSIYLGGTATSLPNVIIGSNNNEAGIFVWGSGSGTTLNTNPSTSIIGDASSPYTFITSNAEIADWSITASHIQNDLSSGTYQTGYVGLSGSNPSYSIWAGATHSDNSTGDAKFSVTPAGQVKASNIQITGGNLDIGAASYSYTGTGTTNSNTLTVSSTTGITTGMYVFGSGIPVGTTVTAIGTGTVTLSKNPTLNITSSPVQFVSTTGSHITSTGNIVAANAILSGAINATSGSFTGNVNIGTNGSLYSGSIDSNGNLTSAGYIINTNGLYFTANGSTNNTYITASGLTTTSANIGGWSVNSNSITSSGNKIVLNNSTGTITAAASNVSSYTAGIAGPTVNSPSTTGSAGGTENVFWAGTGGATSTSNAFRVTMGGDLYASQAYITGGLIKTSGSASSKNVIQIDATNDWVSLGDSAGTGYLVTRNNNIYLTSPSTQLPWSGTQPVGTDTSAPTGTPYFVAGSSFKDSWGNSSKKGIGIFTGAWDYFSAASGTAASSASQPFITATTTGIQLSASADIGMIFDNGAGGSNDPFSSPTMLLYTSKTASAPYSPSTAYGSYIQISNNSIVMSTPTGQGTYIGSDGNSHPQPAQQYIKFGTDGLHINGLTVYGDDARIAYVGGTYDPVNQVNLPSGNTYQAFTRVMQYAPQTKIGGTSQVIGGDIVTGFAVYYGNNSPVGSSGTGFIGDLWVQF